VLGRGRAECYCVSTVAVRRVLMKLEMGGNVCHCVTGFQLLLFGGSKWKLRKGKAGCYCTATVAIWKMVLARKEVLSRA
jgi:hypothetical protein